MNSENLMALVGGVLIGISVSLHLWLNGRVTGISGIVSSLLPPRPNFQMWRVTFILGLLCGGFILKVIYPFAFQENLTVDWRILLAGLFVGFGTALGSGCTSGHGVCGVSRFSFRSAIATLTFMLSGVLVVATLRWLGALQ